MSLVTHFHLFKCEIKHSLRNLCGSPFILVRCVDALSTMKGMHNMSALSFCMFFFFS